MRWRPRLTADGICTVRKSSTQSAVAGWVVAGTWYGIWAPSKRSAVGPQSRPSRYATIVILFARAGGGRHHELRRRGRRRAPRCDRVIARRRRRVGPRRGRGRHRCGCGGGLIPVVGELREAEDGGDRGEQKDRLGNPPPQLSDASSRSVIVGRDLVRHAGPGRRHVYDEEGRGARVVARPLFLPPLVHVMPPASSIERSFAGWDGVPSERLRSGFSATSPS